MTNPDSAPPKRNGRLTILLILAAVAAAILYAVFHLASNTGAGGGLKKYATGELKELQTGQTGPEQPVLSFVDGAGKARTLADFRGRVVLVNLWATWCSPCVAEMPTLAGLARDRAGDSGFAVVAVSMDKPDKTEAAKAFIAGLKEPNLVFYQDPTSQLAFALQSPGLPTTILYDRQGREIARLAGSADWSGADAKALIEAALAQP